MRQAPAGRRQLRYRGSPAARLHRHVLHAHAAPQGSRLHGDQQRTLPPVRVRVRRHRRGGLLPARDDRRRVCERGVLRRRVLHLPRGCRRCLARPAAGLEVHLRPARGGVPRAQLAPRHAQPASGRDQHALGQEPLPDAYQEHHARPLRAELLADHVPGSRYRGVLHAARAIFAAGVLLPSPELPRRPAQGAAGSRRGGAWTSRTWRAGSVTARSARPCRAKWPKRPGERSWLRSRYAIGPHEDCPAGHPGHSRQLRRLRDIR